MIIRIERRFTGAGVSPYAEIKFRKAISEIRNPDGGCVFRMEDIEVPAAFSQVATDILAQKYFRKAGVPAACRPVEEEGVPSWLWRRTADEAALAKLEPGARHGSERSARQVFDRLAGAWTWWGWKGGYFDAEEDARAFYDEMRFMLASQMAAPNSPQWFNTGLHWAYGIDGPSQGHFYVDHETGELTRSTSSYEHPQPHACFIQSVSDDLVNEGGIMDLWTREARLFKYGSGTGSNFSALRGENEPLAGGGKSSGLMSFLKIGDRAAGAIKSGGTTRRAAKMVVVDADHPDIESFIEWKVREEQKVAALVVDVHRVETGRVDPRHRQEADMAAALVDGLLGRRFIDREGHEGAIGLDNILVVAPYNLQVNAPEARLPEGARVGTVDKFQGQEAEVVIASLATSTPDDLPRHVDFFYSKNRLNVAISRARTLALVLANPKLLELDAKTVEHLRLVNTLAWLQAHSTEKL